jgi:hypothetical protein
MAALNQTITDFYKVAQDRDFARDFQFRVLNIQPGDGSSQSFSEDDLVYIRGATLPGKTIASQNVPYMGLTFHVPGSVSYPDSGNWPVTFYCDQNSAIRQVFENYISDVFDDQTSTGNYFIPGFDAIIDLVQLDTQLEQIAKYQLVGIFPTTVGPIGYTIGDGTGAPVTFDVNFSYQFWKKTSPA